MTGVYDELGRLTSVDFDTDGSGTPDETVSYAYDIAGQKTALTFDGQTIQYSYDAKGRLQAMTFDGQTTTFAHDGVNRHIATMRDNFRSHYQYSPAGYLERLRHHKGSQTLADFLYETDKRGNRTKVIELLREASASMTTTTIAHDDTSISYRGAWADTGSYHETTQRGDSLKFTFLGNTDVELTMGEGADHSIYDVYVNETLWQSYDGYASVSGDRVIDIPLTNDGLNTIEIRNTMDVNSASTGHRVRFKQLSVDSDISLQEIQYEYDALSRLIEADYIGGSAQTFGYDLSGNMVNMNGVTRTFNGANQMTHDGTSALTYDNNGNLLSNGAVWDRANRLTTYGVQTDHFEPSVPECLRVQYNTANPLVQSALRDMLCCQLL